MAVTKKKSELIVELRKAQTEVRALQDREAEYEVVKTRLEATLENLKVHQEELRAQNEHLRELQEELKESHHKYFDLFESAPIGYFTLNWQGIILEVNITGAEMLGFGRKHLTQTRLTHQVKASYRKQFLSHLAKIFSGALTDSIEIEIDHPHVDHMFVILESVPMGPKGARTMECRTAMLDITQRKRLEDQLHHGQKLESLGVLAGGIAHDFNNLLAAISSHVGLVLRALPSDTPVKNHLEKIQLAALNGGELANQMLTYSGRGTLSKERLNLTHLVEEIGHLLEVTISKGAVLSYELDSQHTWIQCDPSQIRQIVLNLVTNASESLSDGVGRITLTTGVMQVTRAYLSQCNFVTDVRDGEMAYVEVRDTGTGISPETMKKIFDPFFTTKTLGRGLGLSALVGVMRSHKGAIHVSSKNEEGTTFRVMFPVHHGPSLHSTNSIPVEANEVWHGDGLFLVIDDEEEIRQATELFLQDIGFSVLTAGDGYEALTLFEKHATELQCVLLDMTMPGLNGEQILEAIRQEAPHLPVILSSGYTEEHVFNRLPEQSANGFIQKPYPLETLLETVKGVLGS